MKNFAEVLSANTYPGRGILLGRDESGAHAVAAYFIMGRSVNSRNRVFVPDGDGIRTKAFDESKLTDPSLVIYAPVRVMGETTIVTNGDQTDTIWDALNAGGDFASALRTRCFEPDGPNWTPRISGLVRVSSGKAFYKLSILKAGDAAGSFCNCYFYEYPDCPAGMGRFLHTYRCDGAPIPSFEGEPQPVAIRGGIDEFTASTWESLNADNKVSLFVRYIDLATGAFETRIVNKNK
jgi:IMP cyclohydrolase